MTSNTMSDAEFQVLLRATFLEETDSIFEVVEEKLLTLEQPDNREESLAAIFRAVHTLKGSSASVGFVDLAAFVHSSEDLLTFLRVEPAKVSGEIISDLLEIVDTLKEWVGGLKSLGNACEKPPQVPLLQRRLQETLNRLAGKDLSPDIGTILVGSGLAKPSDIENAVQKQNMMREKRLGDILVDDGVVKRDDLEKAVNVQVARRPATQNNKTFLKVDAERVDAVLDLVGELVVIKSQLREYLASQTQTNENFSKSLNLFDKTVTELHDKALAMRMTSLKSLFVKLERTVRDVAVKLGKQVTFESIGEDTELDRVIIEQLSDPLMHLCRNAVDHGIEAQNIRQQRGKSPVGSLRITTSRRGSNIVIEISDDGNGVNRQRVLDKALKKNIVKDAAAAASLSDAAVFDILFTPGFSTAETVTDVSGRGVGLDVVKANITALKGKIEILSQPGKGTTFRLNLPLTTAITDGMVVLVDGQRIIIPIEVIREFIVLDAAAVTKISPQSTQVEIRGHFLPLIRLADWLHEGTTKTAEKLLVIIDVSGQSAAFLVDEVIGQSQIVQKNIGGTLTPPLGISGAAIMGDGNVALVLDVRDILTCIAAAANTKSRDTLPRKVA